MNQNAIGTAFSVAALVAVLVGIGLILFRTGLLAAVGAILIILGLVSIMPAVRFTVLRDVPEEDVEGA